MKHVRKYSNILGFLNSDISECSFCCRFLETINQNTIQNLANTLIWKIFCLIFVHGRAPCCTKGWVGWFVFIFQPLLEMDSSGFLGSTINISFREPCLVFWISVPAGVFHSVAVPVPKPHVLLWSCSTERRTWMSRSQSVRPQKRSCTRPSRSGSAATGIFLWRSTNGAMSWGEHRFLSPVSFPSSFVLRLLSFHFRRSSFVLRPSSCLFHLALPSMVFSSTFCALARFRSYMNMLPFITFRFSFSSEACFGGSRSFFSLPWPLELACLWWLNSMPTLVLFWPECP